MSSARGVTDMLRRVTHGPRCQWTPGCSGIAHGTRQGRIGDVPICQTCDQRANERPAWYQAVFFPVLFLCALVPETLRACDRAMFIDKSVAGDRTVNLQHPTVDIGIAGVGISS